MGKKERMGKRIREERVGERMCVRERLRNNGKE